MATMAPESALEYAARVAEQWARDAAVSTARFGDRVATQEQYFASYWSRRVDSYATAD